MFSNNNCKVLLYTPWRGLLKRKKEIENVHFPDFCYFLQIFNQKHRFVTEKSLF